VGKEGKKRGKSDRPESVFTRPFLPLKEGGKKKEPRKKKSRPTPALFVGGEVEGKKGKVFPWKEEKGEEKRGEGKKGRRARRMQSPIASFFPREKGGREKKGKKGGGEARFSESFFFFSSSRSKRRGKENQHLHAHRATV